MISLDATMLIMTANIDDMRQDSRCSLTIGLYIELVLCRHDMMIFIYRARHMIISLMRADFSTALYLLHAD